MVQDQKHSNTVDCKKNVKTRTGERTSNESSSSKGGSISSSGGHGMEGLSTRSHGEKRAQPEPTQNGGGNAPYANILNIDNQIKR